MNINLTVKKSISIYCICYYFVNDANAMQVPCIQCDEIIKNEIK